MPRPDLKQFGELEAEDFQRHPVWVHCHTIDYSKPWYKDTDEETFRPWTGNLPADTESILLVRAVIELHDGSRHTGFVTPVTEGPRAQPGHLLAMQQPQMFAGSQQFGFWGGVMGIPIRTQQELYAALGKTPNAIFPFRFRADPGLTTGVTTGQVEGFYRKTSEGVQITIAEPLQEERAIVRAAGFFEMSATMCRGWPQPGGARNFMMRYKTVVYSAVCPHCGIYDRQSAPFRFAKSDQKELFGFLQLNCVSDAFFAPPEIAQEILSNGITGISVGPALDHRTGVELSDRLQLVFPEIIACAETSRLPTVTCRPKNEEAMAIRATLESYRLPNQPRKAVLPPDLVEKIRKDRAKLAALPYCGRVKYHAATSLALTSDSLKDAPDLFQTAEWFGSGGAAFRLTIASERFANLVRKRGWKGLVFHDVRQNGWSERQI
jgi:hypothetical protein